MEEKVRLVPVLVPKWISVKEKLPEEGMYVCVAFIEPVCQKDWWYRCDRYENGQFTISAVMGRDIKYWFQLPMLPENRDKKPDFTDHAGQGDYTN